jgi:hypothetical protein
MPCMGPTPRGTRTVEKGPKVTVGKKGYGLKTPWRPIKVREFEGWPSDGFTTTLGHH